MLRLAAALAALPAAIAAALAHNSIVALVAPRSGRRVALREVGRVEAAAAEAAAAQRWVLEREGGGGLRSGDVVMFRAWTGNRLTLEGSEVHAKWNHSGTWQRFVVELKGGEVGDRVAPGSTVFLLGHTGNRMDVDAPDSPDVVQARWNHTGSWQELAILPRCADVAAEELPELLSTRAVPLPAAISARCGGFGVKMSCRHGFYAASPRTDFHALLYNDAEGKALLVLFDGDDAVLRTKEIFREEVRGLQFDPSARHLVALVSGGTGVQDAPSYFFKLRVPDLEVVWMMPVASPVVGMERWTPDNSDAIAISEERYVLHSAGVCKEGKWCEGKQGDLFQVLNATTGELLSAEGKDWQASHSCKQMVGYNPASDAFLAANAGDAYPKALQYTAFTRGAHVKEHTEFETWGDEKGRQGVTQGGIKAEPGGPGFASVFSLGPRRGEPDRLYFAALSENATFLAPPREVFPNSTGTQLGGNLAPLSTGRWLVAYTAAEEDVLSNYLKTYWDDWGLPDAVREGGSRLAVLDASGRVLGGPVDISASGARFPVEINHLVERPGGIGWFAIDGPGASAGRLVQLRCARE